MWFSKWFKSEPKHFSVDIHKAIELEFLFPNGQQELDEEFIKLEELLGCSGQDFFLPMLLVVNGLFFLHHEVQENVPSIKNFILHQKKNVLSPSQAEILANYMLNRMNSQSPEQKFGYVDKAMKRNFGL